MPNTKTAIKRIAQKYAKRKERKHINLLSCSKQTTHLTYRYFYRHSLPKPIFYPSLQNFFIILFTLFLWNEKLSNYIEVPVILQILRILLVIPLYSILQTWACCISTKVDYPKKFIVILPSSSRLCRYLQGFAVIPKALTPSHQYLSLAHHIFSTYNQSSLEYPRPYRLKVETPQYTRGFKWVCEVTMNLS